MGNNRNDNSSGNSMIAIIMKAAIFYFGFHTHRIGISWLPSQDCYGQKPTGTGLGVPSKSNAAHPGSGLLFGALGDRCTSV